MKQNYILIKKQEIRANCKLLMMTDCPVATEPILCKTVFFLSPFITEGRTKIVNIITDTKEI